MGHVTAPAPMKARCDAAIDWSCPRPLAALAAQGYLDPGVWAADLKVDGTRATLVMGAQRNRFAGTRSESFPRFRDAVVPDLAGTCLDGEFLATPPKGEPATLGYSTGLFNSGPKHARDVMAVNGPPRFLVFDVTHVKGAPVTGHPYAKRRAHLEIIVGWIRQAHPECGIEACPQVELTEQAIAAAIKGGAEGVVLKRLDSPYVPGGRPHTWQKVKALFTADLVITGYRPGNGYNTGKVGAVEVSVYTTEGELRPVAHVGLKPKMREDMTAPDGSLWPKFYGQVIEVAGHGVTPYGRINLPIAVRMRADKRKEDCGEDQLDAALIV